MYAKRLIIKQSCEGAIEILLLRRYILNVNIKKRHFINQKNNVVSIE